MLFCLWLCMSYKIWWSHFNIFAIRSISWSSIKTTEVETVVMGATNKYWVLATVVKNAMRDTIINHARNYPLGCTIPCTQSTLLFSSTKIVSAKSAKNIIGNTFISVTVATSTFTSNVLFYLPPWKLNSTTIHWHPFGRGSRSLATFMAKKTKVCPICVIHAVFGFIEGVLIDSHIDSKFYITSTLSHHPFFSWTLWIRLPILSTLCSKSGHTLWALLLLTPNVILLPTLIVL